MDNSSFETVSLGDYFGVVWRRKWIVLLVTIMFAAAGLLYSMHQQKQYSSTSSVTLSSASSLSNSGQSKNSASATWGAQQLDLANAPAFAKLAKTSPFIAKNRDLNSLSPQDLLNMVAMAPTASGNGIQFVATSSNINDAYAVASAFAQMYPVYLIEAANADPLYAQAIQTKARTNEKLHNLPKYTQGMTTAQQNQAVAKWKTALITAQNYIDSTNAQAPSVAALTTKTIARLGSNPPTQTAPQTTRNIVLGALVGFILGIILAFLQDSLDTRVRNADEIGRRLRLPLLAQVPPAPRQTGGELVMLADPSPALVPSAESYRIAKLNFTGAVAQAGANIVMFTSAGDKDGTSEVVANLALVLARGGKHVVLVDANLRDPVQSDYFRLPASLGLADVLAGDARLADVLTGVPLRTGGGVDAGGNGHAPVDGLLEVVPAGRAPYDPADLLDTRAAGDLLRALSGRADIVLIDAPAILPVTDAMVLASKVDAVVLVTRAGRDSREAVVSLRRALDNCPAPGLAFIVTGADVKKANEYGRQYQSGAYRAERPQGQWIDEERDPRDPREIGVR